MTEPAMCAMPPIMTVMSSDSVMRSMYGLIVSGASVWPMKTLAQTLVIVAGVLVCFAVPAEMRAASIALVVSLASLVQAVLAFWLLRRKTGGVDGGRILGSLWRFVVAAIAAIVAGGGFLVILGGTGAGAFPVSGPVSAIVACVVVGVVMLVVYIGFLGILRSDDLEAGLAPILERAARRSRAPR